MRKIFLLATLIFTLMTATALAADNEAYEYESQVYGFKIICPAKPIVVVNPFEDPKQRGELLVFANDGMKIIFGYQILLDAFDTNKVPDFNKDKKKIIDAYIEKQREDNAYEFVGLETVAKDNKGLVLITAKEIEVKGDNGEVEAILTADEQTAFTYFRSRSGRCISIQLITSEFNEDNLIDYRKSVSTYRDATDLSMPPESDSDKKSKKKK
ncbi:MAG: hypothetical protein IJT73_04800 [Selenomonadaceae bacterium]|nr:hypothetical protein [Selenomonadaceae bacterium]